MTPLTGRAATENLRLLMRLGNSGATFDRRRLAAACRTAAGRKAVAACLRRPTGHQTAWTCVRPTPRSRRTGRPVGVRTTARAPEPSRPRNPDGEGR